MKYLNFVQLAFLVFIIASCSSDSKMERRITALERRVAALETGNTASSTGRGTEVTLASNPQKVNDNTLKPVFSIENIEYDFGTVNEGEIVNHTFVFRNTGKSPLVIDKATASCGCTVPSYSKEPTEPGGQGKIVVEFDSRGKLGNNHKTIAIRSNSNPAVKILNVYAEVIRETNQ